MRSRTVAAATLACALAAPGCGGDDGDEGSASVRAVATTTVVEDIVRNVGAGRADVEGLLPRGADPHEYEPTPGDVRALTEADVVLRSGGDLDEWLGDVVDAAGGDARVVTLIDSVRRLDGDPHWWQDPRNTLLAVRSIRDALSKADPAGRDLYSRNAARYAGRLRTLDSRVAACLRSMPARQRKLVTTHDALGYFARRYRVELVGALIPARSTQAQPSARDVDRLVRRLRREGVKAIFPESALNPKLERAVARDAGVEVGGTLYADALGSRDSGADTYLRAFAHNARAMVEGMTGGERTCSA
jgi:zinc/manganese transport system substrate-binding protein